MQNTSLSALLLIKEVVMVRTMSNDPATDEPLTCGNTKEPTSWTWARKAGQTNERHQDQLGFVSGADGRVSLGLLGYPVNPHPRGQQLCSRGRAGRKGKRGRL